MNHKWVPLLVIIFMVASCVPANQTLPPPPTPLPTVTPLPTITPMPTITPVPTITPQPTIPSTPTPLPSSTPTPYPQSGLLEDTPLYAGPDNKENRIAQLKAGTVVFVLATYGDFVKVEATTEAGMQSGFIGKPALYAVPDGLRELDINEVPWRSMDILSRLALNPDGAHLPTIQGNTIVADSKCGESGWNMDAAFRMTFQVETDGTPYGSLTFKDMPDTNGPYWQGIRRVDFGPNNGMISVGIRDGIYEFSTTGFQLDIPNSQTITVTFLDRFGKVFVVSDQNGQEIKRVDVTQLSGVNLPDGLFPKGTVRISCSVAGGLIKLSSLSLQLAPSGIWNGASALAIQPTLRQLAEQRGITVGTVLTYLSWSNMIDLPFWNTVLDNYNAVTLPVTSATSFWSGLGEYDFSELDKIVDWEIRNHFRVRIPSLVSSSYGSIPGWLRNTTHSRDQYIQILEDYVKTVVGHYKGRVAEWSIVIDDQTPPLSRSYIPRGDFWLNRIGPDYLDMVFRWAKEADPSATLIFDVDNIESPRDTATQSRIDKMVALVQDLKSKGVPIDVVGMQMHLLAPWNSQILPQKADVIQTMKRFADLGVAIYITRFDVNLENKPGTQEQRWNLEAQVYADMLGACLESGVCKSFTTWGVSDATSWETCTQWWCLNLPYADPLMFDINLQPKPAYFAVWDVLAGVPYATPTAIPTSTPRP